MATATTAQKDSHLRHAEYYDLTEVFDDLYARSKAQAVFTDLMPLILSEENIRLAYRNIKRNTGSRTAGVDHRTMKHIEKLSSEEVVSKIRHKLAWYKPKPVRRVEIPKPNGKTRPLGIPAIWDRLVQQCILQILEPICEAKFHDRSNGFRPNRSTEHAIAQSMRMVQIQHLYFVVDVDIKGFFDNAAFLSLTDMNKDLPSYEEIPIALEMPENVRKAYEKAENILQKILRSGTGIAQKILSAYLNLLTVYPDQPYDQPEIVHSRSGTCYKKKIK